MMNFLVLILLLAVAVPARLIPQCDVSYKKIGCYRQVYVMRPLSNMFVNYRNDIFWANFPESLSTIVCRCSKEARVRNLKYFSIRFWGECWGGNDISSFVNNNYAKTDKCKGVDFKKCKHADKTVCAGISFSDYIYETLAPIDGRWSPWKTQGKCSKSCGGGIEAYVRTCTNPRPKYGGKNCEGLTKENRVCNTQPCPVNGGWTKWNATRGCSKSCGGGTQVLTRSCTNPEPQYGGKKCKGSERKKRSCNKQPCPINGGWSTWKRAGKCSRSCDGGRQLLERTCTKPRPRHGGKRCKGAARRLSSCNDQACPVDGGWAPWKTGKCSGPCGRGFSESTRTCTNPSPKKGGRKCRGRSRRRQRCRVKGCRRRI